jgi:hypothetical protein
VFNANTFPDCRSYGDSNGRDEPQPYGNSHVYADGYC